MLTPNMTEVLQYHLTLYINGTSQVVTTVPANTTMVDDVFVVFQSFMGIRYTNYSLSVAVINSAGQGEFSEPSSVGELVTTNQHTGLQVFNYWPSACIQCAVPVIKHK